MNNIDIVMAPPSKKNEPLKDSDLSCAEDVTYCKRCGNLVGVRTSTDRVWTIMNEDGETELEWDDSMCPVQPDINCEQCSDPMIDIDMTDLTIGEVKCFLSDDTSNEKRRELYEKYEKEGKI